MRNIKFISCRKILNSHVEFTNEFTIELDNGSIGIGSSSKGETISIYEDKIDPIDPDRIIETIIRDQQLYIPIDQVTFDNYLQRKVDVFGKNNSFALSLAFYNAAKEVESDNRHTGNTDNNVFPRLCLNILNGGKHAYTNPVVSDFHEYLLVSKSNDLIEIIKDHQSIQNAVRDDLMIKEKILINNNLVNRFEIHDNRKCIELLQRILEDLDLTEKFEIMIDASAGDLCDNDQYRFSVTDNSLKTNTELCSYWINLIRDYNIKYLEDPFHERDYECWAEIMNSQDQCKIIGDNLYSSSSHRILDGAKNKHTNGVIVKPNQAGTVTATIEAIKTSQNNNQFVITSHRSISTESTFLSTITNKYNVEYIKIGPLYSDYSSVVRLNELIRLSENKRA